jgi:hypothetical protein
MSDYVIHISEAEAASDFPGLLARVWAGAEIVIESGKVAIAIAGGLDSSYRCRFRQGRGSSN